MKLEHIIERYSKKIVEFFGIELPEKRLAQLENILDAFITEWME